MYVHCVGIIGVFIGIVEKNIGQKQGIIRTGLYTPRAKEFQQPSGCGDECAIVLTRVREHTYFLDGTCRACGASPLDSKARRPLQDLPKPIGSSQKRHFQSHKRAYYMAL